MNMGIVVALHEMIFWSFCSVKLERGYDLKNFKVKNAQFMHAVFKHHIVFGDDFIC